MFKYLKEMFRYKEHTLGDDEEKPCYGCQEYTCDGCQYEKVEFYDSELNKV